MTAAAVSAGKCPAVFRKLIPYGYPPLLAPPTFPPPFPHIPEGLAGGFVIYMSDLGLGILQSLVLDEL